MVNIADPSAKSAVSFLVQFGAAGTLFYGIQKFFKEVEEKLTDDTKLDISAWLSGVRIADRVQNWPSTFAKLLDKVFGEKHFSWRCFWRSAVCSFAVFWLILLFLTLDVGIGTWTDFKEFISSGELRIFAIYLPAFNVIPDFFSLGKARFAIRLLASATSTGARFLILLADFLASALIAAVPAILLVTLLLATNPFDGSMLPSPREFLSQITDDWKDTLSFARVNLPSALFVSVWLWLYVAGGLILNTARHFDVGYEWFNRRFDTKHKPLQCIGIVAASIVTSLYLVTVLAVDYRK